MRKKSLGISPRAKRLAAAFTAALIVLGMPPSAALAARGGGSAARGAPAPVYAAGDYGGAGIFSLLADGDTSQSYDNDDVFPAVIANNGRVWTDKTVAAGTGASADEFKVTLSAMAQAVQIEQRQAVPSDTVFILDLSFSMVSPLVDTDESRVAVMVDALNDAMLAMMQANPENRIAVVAFGGGSHEARLEPVLPLGRYPEVTDGQYFAMDGKGYVKVNANITDENMAPGANRRIRVLGGTPTQLGIYAGADILLQEAETTVTLNGAEETRKPNIVLLTDGEPTFAWDDYTFADPQSVANPKSFSNGDGNIVDMGPGILTVMTAAYYKRKVSEHYYGANSAKQAGFYTIGLGVEDSDDARATLNPMGVVDELTGVVNVEKISKTLDGVRYNMREVLDSFISAGTASFPSLNAFGTPGSELVTVNNPQSAAEKPLKSYGYADFYAEPATAGELRQFFKDLTQILVSAGDYATSVVSDPAGMYSDYHASFSDYSGAVVFSDVIGEYMRVKSADYIEYGGRRYNGAVFAHAVSRENQGGFSAASPTTAKLLNAMYGSQLFFGTGTDSQTIWDNVTSLLQSCLAAGSGAANGGEYGIYSDSSGSFGNRVMFYADEQRNWVGNYFNKDDGSVLTGDDIPAAAACLVEQYYYSGATHNPVTGNPSDLTYSIFEVVTALGDVTLAEKNFVVESPNTIVPLPLEPRALKSGQQLVRWTVPAALLPLRSVKPVEGGEPDVTPALPIRAGYSVGLKSGFMLSDVRADYAGDGNGDSNFFYANEWQRPGGAQNSGAIAHFVPGADNTYYSAAPAEPAVPYTNNTGTAAFATTGPVKNTANSENSVWYYSLGNNGRLRVPTGTLEVTKRWDAQLNADENNMNDDAIEQVHIQLYRNGAAVGNPQPVVPANPDIDPNGADQYTESVAPARWEGLQLYEAEADGEGGAVPVSYTVAEGEWDGVNLFVPYGADAPYQVAYSQPALNAQTGAMTGVVVNSPKGVNNWVLNLQKSFTVGADTLSAGQIDAILNRDNKHIDFLLFQEIEDVDPGTGQPFTYYLQVPVSDVGGERANRPIRYPDDFANGQRSVWLTGAASAPAAVSFLLVEFIDRNNPISGYDYPTNPVLVGGAAAAPVTQNDWPSFYYAADPNAPTTASMILPDRYEAMDMRFTDAYMYRIANVQSNTAATVAFTNNLTPVPAPTANLRLEKTFTGGIADASAAASFTVEGWESAEAAAAGDLTGRVFYQRLTWGDLTGGVDSLNGGYDFTGIPAGYYTVTETYVPRITDVNGDVWDMGPVAVSDSSGISDLQQGGDASRHYAAFSFGLAANGSGVLALENPYTRRARLTIAKTFAPLPSPVPEDMGFTVTNNEGRVVRTVSYEQLGIEAPATSGSYTIKDLPPGIYTVAEISGGVIQGYYPVQVSADSGTTVDLTSDGTVSFTNTYTPLPAGSLTVYKELTGFPEDWGVNADTTFRVRVKDVTDPDSANHAYLVFGADNTVTGLSPTGGTELAISARSGVTVFGLTVGNTYAVEEVIPEGADFDPPVYFSGGIPIPNGAVPISGGVTVEDDPLAVSVRNNYEHSTAANLIVRKSLLGSYADWGVNGDTVFKVRVYDAEAKNYLWFVEGQNPELPQAQAAAANGVYWCVGNSAEGYSQPVDRARAVYSELPLSAGTPLVLKNLWADADGHRYQIQEVIPASQAERYTNAGLAVVDLVEGANGSAVVRNTFQRAPAGTLIISKRPAGSPADWGVGAATPFRARVKNTDTGNYLTFDAYNKYLGESADGTVVTFSQSAPAVLTSLPEGSYEVEEITPAAATLITVTYEGDVTDATGATGAVDIAAGGAAQAVTAVNTYPHDTGRLIVSKALSGHSAARGATGATVFGAKVYEQGGGRENLLYFIRVDGEANLFECVGSSAGLPPQYDGVPVDNVTLFDTVPFSADRPAILDGLWVDVAYRVEEAGAAQNYTVSYTGNPQTLPRDGNGIATGNITVAVVNTYSAPGGGGGGGGDGGEDPFLNPDTGDSSSMALWIVLFVLSLGGLAGAAVWWKKRVER